MPTIASFQGIIIYMYWAEHGVAHLHAIRGDEEAVFSIETGEIIVGALSRRPRRVVSDWIAAPARGADGELAAGPKWATLRARSWTGQ